MGDRCQQRGRHVAVGLPHRGPRVWAGEQRHGMPPGPPDVRGRQERFGVCLHDRERLQVQRHLLGRIQQVARGPDARQLADDGAGERRETLRVAHRGGHQNDREVHIRWGLPQVQGVLALHGQPVHRGQPQRCRRPCPARVGWPPGALRDGSGPPCHPRHGAPTRRPGRGRGRAVAQEPRLPRSRAVLAPRRPLEISATPPPDRGLLGPRSLEPPPSGGGEEGGGSGGRG
mmetsp:Transcript_56897/g.153377  ORF Transcript_56897/g.153377 Transcript_56897/m.153377 type:complete len:230 (+) Transcript_56897:197-886(+)